MVIVSMLCFLSSLTVSYRFPWCFYCFLRCFFCFLYMFPLFPILDFADCINPFCTCSFEPGSISYFFLHCYRYNTMQPVLFMDLSSIDKNLFKLSDKELTLIPLYGSAQYILMNNCILNSSTKYIENSKRFSGSVFQCSGIFPSNAINPFHVI